MLVSYITTLLVFKPGNLNVDAVWLTEGLISVPPFFPLMSFFLFCNQMRLHLVFFSLIWFMALLLLKNIDQLSWKPSLKTVLGLSDVFSWLSRDYEFLARLPQKWCDMSFLTHHHIMRFMMLMFYYFILALITWLMWFLLGFCTIKLSSFPL